MAIDWDAKDWEAFDLTLNESLASSRAAFKGKYEAAIKGVLGLSRTEIDQITPDSTDLELYDQLITVVKRASSANLSPADLKLRIEKLGDVAVQIAKRVPELAELFK